MKSVTLHDGVEICTILHQTLEPFGFFPALTGGTLYKKEARKDIDIVIYRKRDRDVFEWVELIPVLKLIGFTDFKDFGFVCKCKFNDIDVDLFNPETRSGGDYNEMCKALQ